MKTMKKVISTLLLVCMLASVLAVSAYAAGESIVAISDSSGPLPAYVKMSQKGVILQLHSKPQIDVFKEKFIDEKPKDMIKAFNEMADRERISQKRRKK